MTTGNVVRGCSPTAAMIIAGNSEASTSSRMVASSSTWRFHSATTSSYSTSSRATICASVHASDPYPSTFPPTTSPARPVRCLTTSATDQSGHAGTVVEVSAPSSISTMRSWFIRYIWPNTRISLLRRRDGTALDQHKPSIEHNAPRRSTPTESRRKSTRGPSSCS